MISLCNCSISGTISVNKYSTCVKVVSYWSDEIDVHSVEIECNFAQTLAALYNA